MTSLGWIASSYYARTRNSALLVAMLSLACAVAASAAPAPKKPARAKADLRGTPAERLEAADAARFRRAGAPAAADLAPALAREANPQVRYRLLQAMAAQDPQAAVPALAQALRTDLAPIVRVAAAQELGRLDERPATAALVAALSGDADLDVRRAAAASLGLHRSTEAVAGLAAAASQNDAGVRRHAALSLVRQPRGPAVERALRRLRADPDRRVSEAAGRGRR